MFEREELLRALMHHVAAGLIIHSSKQNAAEEFYHCADLIVARETA
jgi:hypothetical protein